MSKIVSNGIILSSTSIDIKIECDDLHSKYTFEIPEGSTIEGFKEKIIEKIVSDLDTHLCITEGLNKDD